MKRGEIWFVSLDPTSVYEKKGTRPVLIVSPEAFNHLTKHPLFCPLRVEKILLEQQILLFHWWEQSCIQQV